MGMRNVPAFNDSYYTILEKRSRFGKKVCKYVKISLENKDTFDLIRRNNTCFVRVQMKRKSFIFWKKKKEKEKSFHSGIPSSWAVTRSVFSAIYLDPLRGDLNFQTELTLISPFKLEETYDVAAASFVASIPAANKCAASWPRVYLSKWRRRSVRWGVGRAAKWLINRR